MTSMVFSNIGYMKKLKASGLTEAQSSVISEGFEQMRELQIEMATKGDIRNIREEILELKSNVNQTKHAISMWGEMNKLHETISYQGDEFRLHKDEIFKKFDELQKSLINDWIAKTSILFLMGLSIVLGVMVYLHR